MSRTRPIALVLGVVTVVALTLGGSPTASADPVPGSPGTPPPGLTPSQIYAGVGADAFAELTNNLASAYNASTNPGPVPVLASYDAINPVTGVPSETITTKPGCPLSRPNGANAGVTAILLNQMSTVDPTSPCIDFVRSSRAKGTASGEANLTFFAQSRDAVSYAVLGNAYAPTTPLTTTDLKDIFECVKTDWSEVGGQAGDIHLYLPPTTAATYTFFLSAIGSSVTNVQAGCGGLPTVFSAQQNDGRTMNGDPQGIAPYAVTKWAAQSNGAPGISDLRGGAQIGLVNTTTSPFTTSVLGGTTYLVLNPNFASGSSTAFGRYFFNVVRNTAPQGLQDVFNDTGYLCAHEAALLVPFGNTPLGSDHTQTQYCGKPN